LDVNLSAKAVTSKPFDVSRIPANYNLEMLSVTLAELQGFRRCRKRGTTTERFYGTYRHSTSSKFSNTLSEKITEAMRSRLRFTIRERFNSKTETVYENISPAALPPRIREKFQINKNQTPRSRLIGSLRMSSFVARQKN